MEGKTVVTEFVNLYDSLSKQQCDTFDKLGDMLFIQKVVEISHISTTLYNPSYIIPGSTRAIKYAINLMKSFIHNINLSKYLKFKYIIDTCSSNSKYISLIENILLEAVPFHDILGDHLRSNDIDSILVHINELYSKIRKCDEKAIDEIIWFDETGFKLPQANVHNKKIQQIIDTFNNNKNKIFVLTDLAKRIETPALSIQIKHMEIICAAVTKLIKHINKIINDSLYEKNFT
jgi:hypothetical protein